MYVYKTLDICVSEEANDSVVSCMYVCYMFIKYQSITINYNKWQMVFAFEMHFTDGY